MKNMGLHCIFYITEAAKIKNNSKVEQESQNVIFAPCVTGKRHDSKKKQKK